MSAGGRRARRWAVRLGASAAGLLLAPLALEAGYRALRAGGLSPASYPENVEHDDRLGWRYEPGSRARHVTDEFDVEVRINRQGFRGPDWPEGPKTRPRVLVLGDSFAFGWGVEHEQSLVARLQSARPDREVLGAGVSGYGADQECLLLEELAPRLDPDVVVVVFCENDLFECADDVAYGKRKPRFARAPGGLELCGVPVPCPWIERTSLVWRALQKARWERAQVGRERDPNGEWALVCDIYRRMRTALRGRPLVLVSDTERLARLAAEEEGIEHVDLHAALNGAAGPVRFARDGHWTALGHERVAAALAAALP